jgi:type II secretory pathway component GspD/PulD (secretin)
MKPYLSLMLFGLLSTLFISPAHSQSNDNDFYRPWVDYRNGAISLAFERTPIPFALSALHATTGFQIVIPPASERKLINLKINQQSLEPAVRSLITSIGYKNFALIYDDKGQPNRAVVLPVRPEASDERVGLAKNESVVQPLSAEEQDALQKDLERWQDLKQEERGRIEDRLKNLPQSDERDQLVKIYGNQILALTK